jgi:hypothetical protein
MKKIFEDFLNLFFPDSDNEDEKNPFWEKVIGFVLILIVLIFFIIVSV